MMTSVRVNYLWVALLALPFVAACGGEQNEAPGTAQEQPPVVAQDTTALPPAGAKINLNTASEDEFRTIPGVGDRMVHEFMEYRPYVSIQQFRREIGKYVDEAQVAAYEQYLYVPVDPNEADAETLRQLPGIDADEAERLIAGRPYASGAVFLDSLSAYISPEDASAAQQYLAAP